MRKFYPLFFAIFSFVFFTGYSDLSLQNIENAFLRKDYPSVLKLAEEYLGKNPPAPSVNKVYYYAGTAHVQLKDYDKAQEYFEKIIRNNPEARLRDQANLGIFDVCFMKENYGGAARVIKKVLEESPSSDYLSSAYLKAAKASLKLAEWEQAGDYLRKIVQKYPNSFEYPWAKQLLEEKQYFAVQVGAFMEQQRAEEMVDELKKRNEYAYVVVTKDEENQKFYRVRVGQLASLEEAKTLQSHMTQLGYPGRIYP